MDLQVASWLILRFELNFLAGLAAGATRGDYGYTALGPNPRGRLGNNQTFEHGFEELLFVKPPHLYLSKHFHPLRHSETKFLEKADAGRVRF